MNSKLLDAMIRHGIGFDPFFFEKHIDAPNFPPHNIVELEKDRHYRLTLAVAGFTPDEVQVVREGDLLTVVGHKEESGKDGHVLYRGIAYRDFSRQFKIGDNVQVQTASMKHGLLEIDLVRELPEAMRPKLIPIST